MRENFLRGLINWTYSTNSSFAQAEFYERVFAMRVN